MLEEAEILEAVDKLPVYHDFSAEKPSPEQTWEGNEGHVHFWATKRITTSHGGGLHFFLGIEGNSPEEREKFVSHFIEALGEPLTRKTDPKWPDDEYLSWYDVESIIEQKKRDRK